MEQEYVLRNAFRSGCPIYLFKQCEKLCEKALLKKVHKIDSVYRHLRLFQEWVYYEFDWAIHETNLRQNSFCHIRQSHQSAKMRQIIITP